MKELIIKNHEKMKIKKSMKERGITLVALVITIIILLILAGVTLSSALSQNGLFQRAKIAEENYKKAEAEENEKIKDINDEIDIISDNRGKEKLAKEVLKINPSATNDYEKSPYVKYNNIVCRVFYNDNVHGLQIISQDVVDGEVILGYETSSKRDKSVEQKDFDYSGKIIMEERNRICAASYNRALITLRENAKNYLSANDKIENSSKKIVLDSRCLGSIATLKNGRFDVGSSEWLRETEFEKFSECELDDKLYAGDDNYLEDAGADGQLKKIGLSVNEDVFLGSRDVWGLLDRLYFNVRVLGSNEFEFKRNGHYIFGLSDYGTSVWALSGCYYYPIMVVFLISDEAKIIGGDGKSEDSAYVLG